MKLKNKLLAWRDRSVGNRLAFNSVGTALALVLLLGAMALPLFMYHSWQIFHGHAANALDRFADKFEFRLRTSQQSLEHLAANSFVINALVDSSGRDIYLQPTLRDFLLPIGIPSRTVLFDANLSAFAGNHSSYPATAGLVDALAKLAFKSEKPQATVLEEQGRKLVALAIPVYYPPASAFEGVLVGVLDSEAIFRPALDLLLDDECLSITVAGKALHNFHCDAARLTIREQRPLLAGSALGDSLQMAVTYGGDTTPLFRQFGMTTASYLLVCALALLAAVILARRAGRLFTGQLEALGRASQELAKNPLAPVRVQWESKDEIGNFAELFNAMVSELQDLHVSLERRVEERTLELAEARDRADAANVAKSQFLATMSHEIRTPMNGILGMAQLLAMPGISEEERQEYASTVLKSGKTLLALLNDILDLSKVESGRIELVDSEFGAQTCLTELHSLFAQSAMRDGLRLSCQWNGPLEARYLGDIRRLRQMLSNYVSNALKFTEHGEVCVEGHESRRDGDKAELLFTVTDTGIGIPAEKLPLLFQPFSQIDGSTTRKYGGTGLGLSIVRSLARQMGGDASVISTEGEGSSFWLRIPVKVAPASPSEAIEAPVSEVRAFLASDPTNTGIRVLVAEDNPVNARLIVTALGKQGFEVEVVEDGRQAVTVLERAETPDLILMDCEMPVMDGLTATGHIRRIEQERGLERHPVIAITANAFEEDRQRCLAAGMDDFIAKPVDLADLLGKIEQWLSSKKTGSPAAGAIPASSPQTPEAGPIAGAGETAHDLQAQLRELDSLLAGNKFNAVTRFRALQPLLIRQGCEPQAREVGALIAELRFTEARALIRLCAERQGWMMAPMQDTEQK